MLDELARLLIPLTIQKSYTKIGCYESVNLSFWVTFITLKVAFGCIRWSIAAKPIEFFWGLSHTKSAFSPDDQVVAGKSLVYAAS